MDRKLRAELEPLGVRVLDGDVLALALPTPTLPPATTTNHYVIGRSRALLVDPATPDRRAQDKLHQTLALLTANGWQFQALLLTHHHHDHVGAAMTLSQRMDLPIWAHAATATRLAGEVTVHAEISDGALVAQDADGSQWRALHTPGHAAGHLVLQNDQHLGMIAGDMVAGEGTIVVDPRDGRMADYLASLERMAQAKPAFLAPSHGAVLPDAQAVLRHYREHRLAREAKVRAALPTKWTPPHDLLPAAYGDVARRHWPLALRALLAHLIHLEEQGLAQGERGLWRRAG